MKGPGLRIRNDVRRRWKCPETGNILKTPGSVTHLYSPFVKQASWMKLEEDQVPVREQISLEKILERMVIEVPEEDPASKEEQENQDEVAQVESPPDTEEAHEDTESDSDS